MGAWSAIPVAALRRRHCGSSSRDLTDEELERLETTLESEGDAWPGEEAGRSVHDLKEILAKEAEHEERVRASAEESRRRDRELVAHNRALAGLPPLENDE